MKPPLLIHLRLLFYYFILFSIFFIFYFFFYLVFFILFFFSLSQTVDIETRRSTPSSLSSPAVLFDEHFDRLRIVDALRKRIHRTFEADELAKKKVDQLKEILRHLGLDEKGRTRSQLITRLVSVEPSVNI